MAWPNSQDYNEAVQSPSISFSDPDLQRGEAATNALGLPMPRSGNFADVYEFRTPEGRWAVKCFTRETPNLCERYSKIGEHLRQAKLPFLVDFQFQEQGIRIRGQWYPILKMQWVDGQLLNEIVRNNLDKPHVLDALLTIWRRMAVRLRESGICHGDLQHGNVLLVPGERANTLAVKLVDYDGMWIPSLAALPSSELGHSSFQHPARAKGRLYSVDLDKFPLLTIATALRAVRLGGAALWNKHDNGDNLLFRESDF